MAKWMAVEITAMVIFILVMLCLSAVISLVACVHCMGRQDKSTLTKSLWVFAFAIIGPLAAVPYGMMISKTWIKVIAGLTLVSMCVVLGGGLAFVRKISQAMADGLRRDSVYLGIDIAHELSPEDKLKVEQQLQTTAHDLVASGWDIRRFVVAAKQTWAWERYVIDSKLTYEEYKMWQDLVDHKGIV